MDYVVIVCMIVCVEYVTIGGRGNGVVVKNQVQLTVRPTHRDMMRPVGRRHHGERPRYLARDAHSEQEEYHELAADHWTLEICSDSNRVKPSPLAKRETNRHLDAA